jgi:CheY-like chemotaxis protein
MGGNGNGAKRNSSSSSASVFIVEDEAIIAQDVRITLEGLGYRIIGISSSGEESVRRVAALQPDLVLMDIKIKGPIDGLQAGGEILSRFRIPVVFMSAYSDPGPLGASLEEQRAKWIRKPFDTRELREALEASLLRGCN